MEKLTINEGMVLMKQLRERLQDLKTLRTSVSTKQTYRQSYGEKETENVTEPQYDVKWVDKKITMIQNALYLLDANIKQANANTTINAKIDVEVLLAPLE